MHFNNYFCRAYKMRYGVVGWSSSKYWIKKGVTCYIHGLQGGPHRNFDLSSIFFPPRPLYINNDQSLIRKKATLHVQHTFLYISLKNKTAKISQVGLPGDALYRSRTRQVFAFPPCSRPASPMTIGSRVLVAVMEGKLELGLGLG